MIILSFFLGAALGFSACAMLSISAEEKAYNRGFNDARINIRNRKNQDKHFKSACTPKERI